MEGRGDHILLPSVLPAQVQGRHNTMRVIMEGVGDTIQTLEAWGKTPACSSVSRLDTKRNLKPVKTTHSLFGAINQDWQLQFGLETGKD